MNREQDRPGLHEQPVVRLLGAIAALQDTIPEPGFPGGGDGYDSWCELHELDGMLAALRAVLGLPADSARPDTVMLGKVADWRRVARV